MSFQTQRIRDPLHNLITFQANEFEHVMWRVIQTRPFQRLRRIKQLGFSEFVYPGASHSRFAHSLGVFHVARKLMRIIKVHLGQSRYLETRAHQAIAAALVHDLGHGPFSHAFEEVGRRLNLRLANHEEVSDAIIRDGEMADTLNELGSGFSDDVASIIKAAGPGNIYSAVVSSQFDADRLDYMQRDRLMTGTQQGAIDFEWLLANIEVGEVPSGVDEESLGPVETFVLGPKAIYAAESYVLGLFQLYPSVYFHKTTRGAEKLFTELLCRVVNMIGDGSVRLTGLAVAHPLVQFARNPEDLNSVLRLDDVVVSGALASMADAKDESVCELARRLRDRSFYKAIDVRERLNRGLREKAKSKGRKAEEAFKEDGKIVDRMCANIREDVRLWLSKQDGETPRILVDQEKRDPYKPLQESKGPLNQIRIRIGPKELVDLGDRSRIVRAIEPFQLFRLYVSKDDKESRTFIDKVIAREVANGAQA
jgi:uncharacterized protein